MKRFVPNWLKLLLVTALFFTQIPLFASADSGQGNPIVTVNKTVSPQDIKQGGETEVTLSIKGSNPVNYVKPNDVILIIDRSGSMLPGNNAGEDKMSNAKKAAINFIDIIDYTKHQVGIVDFSSDVSIQQLTTNADNLKNYVSGITANGGTATASAIEKARELLSNHRTGAQPVIILMTDGQATLPKPESSAGAVALEQAKLAKQEGIVFYTVALLNKTENPDISAPNILLKDMATTAQHHHFVLGSDGLNEIYQAIVKEIGLASAYDVTLTDTIAPEFELVPGSYENNIPRPTLNGNKLEWKFLELKEETLTFKYKIRHKSDARVGALPAGNEDIHLTYKNYLDENQLQEINQPIVNVSYYGPIITSVVQDNGNVQGGEQVEINGDYFQPDSTVKFGNTLVENAQYVSPNQIIVQAPAGVQGNVEVVVTNIDGQNATATYRYFANPIITAIAPNSGPLAGGNEVVITGNYFMNGANVTFGDQKAVVVSQTVNKITVKAPASIEKKAVNVTVTNPDATTTTLADAYTYVAGPEINSVTPNKGLVTGGESVKILGSEFIDGAKVYLNNKEAVTTFISANELTIITPAWASAQSVDVKVINPDKQENILKNGYTFENLAPVITTISPNEGQMEGSALVTITGENFLSGAKVYFKDTPISIVTVASSTSIRFRTPAWGVSEKVTVKVVNPDAKYAEVAKGYYYLPKPAPVLKSVTPSSGSTAGGESVTIAGSNFVAGAKVLFNTTEITPQSVSSTSIVIKTPKWDKAEYVNVKVLNPDGQHAVLENAYQFIAPPPPPGPVVTSISPDNGPLAGYTLAVVTGENFKSGTKLYFGDTLVSVASVLSETQIRIRVPAATMPGKVAIKAVNPDNQEYVLPDGYEYLPPEAPTITSLAPNEGLVTGGTVVSITGTNFNANSKVVIGTIEVATTYVSAIKLKFVTPAWSTAEAVDVSVKDQYGQVATLSGGFTYTNPIPDPAPVIISVSANSGLINGGEIIYVNGENFKDTAQASFGGVNAITVFVNSGQLKVRTPSWSQEETVDIQVTNPDGQIGILASGYTFTAPPPPPSPIVLSVSPDKGVMAGNEIITVNGENFVDGVKVYFNDKLVISSFISDTQIRVRTLNWANAEVVDVTVVNPSGESDTLLAGFTYELPAKPIITSITPNTAYVSESKVATIVGENFDSGSKVYIGGVEVITTYVSTTQLKVRTPVWSSLEDLDVRVVTSIGQEVTLAGGFSIIPVPPKPDPVVTKLTIITGSVNGSTILYINGANFQSGASVYFGANKAISSFVSNNQLKVRTPASTVIGPVDVKIVNPDGTQVIISGAFTYY